MPSSDLSLFHPLIKKWFSEKVGAPTDVQVKTWPEIAKNRHVLVIAAKRLGKDLAILTGVEDPRLPEYLALFKDLLGREFKPVQKISIETINGEPALRSPYAGVLKTFGFRPARNTFELWKEY